MLEEFDALYDHQYFARAYALLHTACEELAKFSILELGGKRLAQGNPPPWKRFWQRFRSHDSKLAQLNIQLFCLLAESEEVAEQDIVEAVEKLFDYGLVIRNSALYAELGPDGKFRTPADIEFRPVIPILRAAAKLALGAADRRGESIDDIELSLRASPHQLEKRNALIVLARVIQRAKDAGLEKEEVTKMLEKFLGKSL